MIQLQQSYQRCLTSHGVEACPPRLVNDLVERADNDSLVALAEERLRNQRSERIPLEQALAQMRDVMLGSSAE